MKTIKETIEFLEELKNKTAHEEMSSSQRTRLNLLNYILANIDPGPKQNNGTINCGKINYPTYYK